MSQFYVNGNSGSGGGGVETIAGDTGSITGSNVTIYANNATNNSGASVQFVNSGTVSTLNLSDNLFNTFLGRDAGNKTLTGDTNVGIGRNALSNITTATKNICIGLNSGISIQPGDRNIAIGDNALAAAVSADQCIAMGSESLMNCQSDGCIAIGASSFTNLTTGTSNLGIGISSGRANTTGSNNICIGESVFRTAVSNDNNIGIGYNVGVANTGDSNTVIGALAFVGTGSATQNSLVGFQAGNAITSGNSNSGFGYAAINQLTTGTNNIGIGSFSGLNYDDESNNIVIGNQGIATDNGAIRIGTTGTHTSFYAQGIAGVTVGNSQFVTVDTNGQLGSLATQNVQLNYSSANVDVTQLGVTPVFTAVGGNFLVTSITTLTTNISGTAAGFTFSFGWTGPNYNDLSTGIGNISTQTNQYNTLPSAGFSGSPQLTVPVGDTLNINITTPDGTATTNIQKFYIQGFYV